jgi:ATP-binding cassette subfamily B multidrug efflux pump
LKSLLQLNRYLLRYKYFLLLGIIFISISNIFAIYPAAVIKHALDQVIEGVATLQLIKDTNLKKIWIQWIGNQLIVFSVIIVTMALLKGFFMFFMRQTIIVMSRWIEYDMKNEIFEHYQKLDIAFYKRNNTGDLMNRISEDVSRVRMYVGPAIMYSINLLVLFVLIVQRMISVNAELTMLVLIPLPILSVAVYLINSTILKRSEQVQQQLSVLSNVVQEAFSGIRILKLYNRLSFLGFKFEDDVNNYRDKNLSLVSFNSVFFPLIMLLIGVSTLIVVGVGGIKVASGSITSGVIAEFIIYVNMLTWPVASIGWVTSIIQRAAASQQRINEFLNAEPQIVSSSDLPVKISGLIEFKNVSLIYPDTGIEALNNVSFSVQPGQTLGIIGRTGSGKSTIAQLLMRFYDVNQGSVLFDNKDIQSINISEVRNQIGYVPQDVFLFSDTILQNIIFGLNLDLPKNELSKLAVEAAKSADIHESIMHFPLQYETKIGERGITLSGGQKQRISIARAIIKSPQLFIFDDCLSAVDNETEEKILNNLIQITKGKTNIIISHRVSSLKHADHIIVLDHGKIVEEGSHYILMEMKGEYFDLYNKQVVYNQ